jgi:hypothetical protein
MNMTAITNNTGWQNNVHSAIATAIESHSPAVAASALEGSTRDSSFTIEAGRRSGIALLVLCGWGTTGLVEMSCAEISDRRNVMTRLTLVTLEKYDIIS